MHAPARRPVVGFDLHDPQARLIRRRSPQWKARRVRPVHLVENHPAVFPHDAVGDFLRVLHRLCGHILDAQLDGRVLCSEMDGYRFQSGRLHQGLGEDVLPRVLHHVVLAMSGVHGAANHAANRPGVERRLDDVHDVLTAQISCSDAGGSEGADVAGLPAASRIEGGAVQLHLGSAVARLHSDHLRLENELR